MLGRRAILVGGLFGLAPGLGFTKELQAKRRQPELHLACQVTAALTPNEIATAADDATRRGWTPGVLPPLQTLQPQIARDFRAGETCLVRRIRFSRTEVTWFVALAQGHA